MKGKCINCQKEFDDTEFAQIRSTISNIFHQLIYDNFPVCAICHKDYSKYIKMVGKILMRKKKYPTKEMLSNQSN